MKRKAPRTFDRGGGAATTVFASGFDWFIGLSATVVIGQLLMILVFQYSSESCSEGRGYVFINI